MSALKYIFLSHCQTVCENCKLLLEVHVHVCAVSSSIAELVVELVIKLKKRLVRASWLVIVHQCCWDSSLHAFIEGRVG